MSDFQSSESATKVTSAEATPTQKRSRQPGRWVRWLYQFSLRSLLIATTLIAVGCWWFLRPKSVDEQLAGEEMRLRRQVRTVRHEDAAARRAAGEPEAETVNDGSWQMVDFHGHVLVDGHMVRDKRAGTWTSYHSNGRKAAEGTMSGDARIGTWRTWNAAGQLTSEVIYRPAASGGKLPSSSPAHRHGPAKAWHDNGQLKSVGQFENDLRTGQWTYYNQQGETTEQGNFAADVREGTWQIRDASGQLQSVRYIDGRTEREHEGLLATLVAALKSPQAARRLAAAERLESLGKHGTELLESAFRDGDELLKLFALRALVRGGNVRKEFVAEIEPLVEHTNPALAVRALLAVYEHHPEPRKELYEQLTEKLDQCELSLRIETLRRLCTIDPQRQAATFVSLVKATGEQPRPWYHDPFFDDVVPSNSKVHVTSLDLTPITSLDGNLPALLLMTMHDPDERTRAIAVVVASELADRDPTVISIVGSDRRKLPADLQEVIDLAKQDPSGEVRVLADSAERSGCGCGNAGGFGGVF